jgi:hypothetical protein
VRVQLQAAVRQVERMRGEGGARDVNDAETRRVDGLREKWLLASQQVLEALLNAVRRSSGGCGGISMLELMRGLGVDYDMVRYDEHKEEFVSTE